MLKKINSQIWFLVIILGCGVVVRGVFLAKYARLPSDQKFVADPYAYLMMANRAYHGHLFVSFRGFHTSYLSVGYPATIALAQRITCGLMSTWRTALMLNVLSYILTSIGIIRVVRIFAQRTSASARTVSVAGLVATAVLAIYPDFVFATGLVMTELVAVALFVWGIAFFVVLIDDRYSHKYAIAAGLCFGLTVFIRPSILLIVLLAPFLLLLRRQWKSATVLFTVAILPIVPLWINNSRVGTGPGITSATWMNVCDGLKKSDGTFQWRPECRRLLEDGKEPSPLTESINTSHAKKLALSEISTHPWAWISRMPLRMYHSLWSGGWATQVSVKWGQNYQWTERMDLFLLVSRRYFEIIAIIASIQIVRMTRRGLTTWWPMALVFIGTFAGIPISFGQARFGWPCAVIVLVPLASLGLIDLYHRQRYGSYVFIGK